MSPFARHSEPVRPPLANGPEQSEGAQGKLREESVFSFCREKQMLRCAQHDDIDFLGNMLTPL
jgi:hypothetical protein